ncbi:MAG: hypothetical protein QOJ80_4454, partial [Mycobacterium sp.]|nr:hypothetical protein [Mycobacterium sp.]
MHSAAAQVAEAAAAEVAAVADQRVLRKEADPVDRREAAATGDHRPTSMMVEVAAVADQRVLHKDADRMDHRAAADLTSTVVGPVTST